MSKEPRTMANDTVQVDPVAAVNLLSAECGFYRNRCLLLENEVINLRRLLEATEKAKAEVPARKKDVN
ncbi:MAG: hypothetical protein ACTHOP_02380 [Mesorhizobium sp.]